MDLTSLFPRESSEKEEDYQVRLNALAGKAPTFERIAEALCPESLGLPDGERAIQLGGALEEVESAVSALKTRLDRAAWIKTLLAEWQVPGGYSRAPSVLREAAALVRALSQHGAFPYLFDSDGLDPFRGCYTGIGADKDGWEVATRVAPAAWTRPEAARCVEGLERIAAALDCGPARLAEEVADCQRADLRPAERGAFRGAKEAILSAFRAHATPVPPPPTKRRGRPRNVLQQRFEDFARAVCELHGLTIAVKHRNFAADWQLPSDFFQTQLMLRPSAPKHRPRLGLKP
jgi:hypothetical protein